MRNHFNYIQDIHEYQDKLKETVVKKKIKDSKQNDAKIEFYEKMRKKLELNSLELESFGKSDDLDEMLYITYDSIVDKLKKQEMDLISKGINKENIN